MYCISCGKKGVHWPKHEPKLCSMRGGAYRLLGEYSASPDGFYCPDCGGYDTGCTEIGCGGFLEAEV